ncbi:MAG: hypothetical protein Q8898_13265 [Bacillota bacterium]|nr:hypothetical protein [Bacillota bacterium]
MDLTSNGEIWVMLALAHRNSQRMTLKLGLIVKKRGTIELTGSISYRKTLIYS